MNRRILVLALTLCSITVLAQKPDFSLVGFGVGTTGGTGGTTVTVTTYDQFAAEVAGTTKKIIKVSGTITGPGGGVILDIGSNKSIIGIGNNALISMTQLHLKNSQQVIIQNLKFSMIGSTLGSDADMISMETTSANEVKYIWVDHCEFYNIKPTLPETASKKDLYDGMLDIKKSSSLITISWNYFHDHWKGSLVGFTDTDVYDRKITYHHNYFKDIKSRTPSYRGGTGHLYNNYFDGLNDPNSPKSDGIHSRENACLLVEGNSFRNYSKTIYNAIADCTYEGFAYGTDNTFVNAPGQTAKLCSSFSPPYTYKLDKSTAVPCIVATWSGVGKIDAAAFTLTNSTDGNGTIETDPASCTTYASGTQVTLTAKPASGYAFKSWGGGATGTTNPTTIAMDANKSVTATFSILTGVTDNSSTNVSFNSYPSPIVNTVKLAISLPEAGKVIVSVKDYMGRVVIAPSSSLFYQGENQLSLEMGSFPSGIYFCTLQYGNTILTRKLIKE